MAAVLILLLGTAVIPRSAGSAFTHTTSNGASSFTAATTFSPTGGLYTWGQNVDGQLGLGDTAMKTSPVQVGTDATWTGMAQGAWHACATRSDNTLWCWGYNAEGQLGRGNLITPQTTPVKIGTLTTWRSVAAGQKFNCATHTDNTLWCWGDNTDGQLGRGTFTTPGSSPVKVGTLTTWSRVTAGFYHACAVKTDGTLWCWGFNTSGQLGRGNTTSQSAPVQVGTDTNWNAVGAGDGHTCAVKTDGTLWCWGSNMFGQLGRGNTATPQLDPVQIGSLTTWSKVTAGSYYTCATRTDNTLFCWGDNTHGQLGQGDTTPATSPVPVPGNTWQSVMPGANHTCALKTDGTLWCWGRNTTGQLGRSNTTTPGSSPVQIGLLTTWKSLASGATSANFSTAIR